MDARRLRELLTSLPVSESAPLLLGATLHTALGSCLLVEVEAYGGIQDAGSHAFRGQTPRNKVMFGTAGHIYTYFNYGKHWMLNITARPPAEAGAILIRAAVPLDNLEVVRKNRPKAKSERELTNGPGKLCAAYGIGLAHYGLDALDSASAIWIEPADEPFEMFATTRIGLAPGKGDDLPWRFVANQYRAWASKGRVLPTNP